MIDDFTDKISGYLKERLDDSVTISRHDILKNNGVKLLGLTIKENLDKASPTIYMNYYYDHYMMGESIEELGERIYTAYLESRLNEDIDVNFYLDFDKVKERIKCKVINYELNRELLENVPYERYLDLAIVCYCPIKEMNAGILVNNSHLQRWGQGIEEIVRIAKENTRKNERIALVPIEEMLKEAYPDFDIADGNFCPELYVAYDSYKEYGAVCMCFEENLAAFAKKMGGDYYILPSSIHEILIIRAEDRSRLDELSEMVRCVNRSELDETEVLSNHAYFYSDKQKILKF